MSFAGAVSRVWPIRARAAKRAHDGEVCRPSEDHRETGEHRTWTDEATAGREGGAVAMKSKTPKAKDKKAAPQMPFRGYWDDEEEQALRDAVQKHGIGAWEKMRHDPDFKVLKCVHRARTEARASRVSPAPTPTRAKIVRWLDRATQESLVRTARLGALRMSVEIVGGWSRGASAARARFGAPRASSRPTRALNPR